MPGRHAASGDISPGTHDNINVAMPQPKPPSTKLRLRLTPKEPEPEPEEEQPAISRPKRKISRPARYSDYVFEPPTKKRASAASVMSSRKSTSPPPTPASEPVIITSSKPIEIYDADESEDKIRKPVGYGADFLFNFIDDTPRSNGPTTDIASGLVHDPVTEPDSLLDSDPLPEPTSLPYDALTDVVGDSPMITGANDDAPIILSSTFSSLPQQQQPPDGPDQIINKLQVACHALSNLNIPPVPTPYNPQSPPSTQQGENSSSSPALSRRDLDVDESAQSLLFAAAGSDSVEGKPYAGEPDEDLLFLIRNAIQILRNHIVSKNHLEGRARSVAGKDQGSGKKRSKKGQYKTDTERFAMSSLEQLLQGGATNIGCIISKERAHLMWHLYMQLLYLVTAPHFVLPRQYQFLQQPVQGMMPMPQTMPHLMGPPHMMPMQPSPLIMPPHKAGPVPPPHQFLARQKSQYISPNPFPQSFILTDQSKMVGHRQGIQNAMPVFTPMTGGLVWPGPNGLFGPPMPNPYMVMQPHVQMQVNGFAPPIPQPHMFFTQMASTYVPGGYNQTAKRRSSAALNAWSVNQTFTPSPTIPQPNIHAHHRMSQPILGNG